MIKKLEKQQLRDQYRHLNQSQDLKMKQKKDAAIHSRILALTEYAKADSIFIYLSTPNEVDTLSLIQSSLLKHKQVAVPLTHSKTYEMTFYLMDNLQALRPGYAGILEPDPCKNISIHATSSTLCLVPAFRYDSQGYRLGWGKGCYDRFLSHFPGISVGFCYTSNITWRLPREEHDRAVDILITDQYSRKIKKEL